MVYTYNFGVVVCVFLNICIYNLYLLKNVLKYYLINACSLLSAGDRSNIILRVPRSNHKKQGKFKNNVIIKKNNLGEEEKYFCFVIVNKNNNKNLFKSIK